MRTWKIRKKLFCLCPVMQAVCWGWLLGDERELFRMSDGVGCQVHIEIGPIQVVGHFIFRIADTEAF